MRILFMLPAAKGVYPDEAAQRRISRIKSYETPATQIDVDYLPEPSGFVPWGGQNEPDHRTPEKVTRTHDLGARRALQAEKEGYDAFCPFGGVDVGVMEARRRGLTIPAAGPGEAAALFCGLLGRKFASCSYVKTDGGNSERYTSLGIGHLHVGQTAIGFPNSEYPARHHEVLERYKDCVRQAKEWGAELMGSFGQSICPTEFSAKELMDATGGFPAMDALAAQIGMVEWWHRTGLPPALLKSPR